MTGSTFRIKSETKIAGPPTFMRAIMCMTLIGSGWLMGTSLPKTMDNWRKL
jgi:hypothetical protein